jgi:hypothetical protein
MSTARGLTDAVREKFGADMERQFSNAIGLGVATFDVTSATETIHGDRATVDIGAGPGEIPLVRAGDTWKISAQVMQTLNANAVKRLATGVPAIEQLTADVRAGKYQTVNELQRALAPLMPGTRPRPASGPASRTGAMPQTRPAAQRR